MSFECPRSCPLFYLPAFWFVLLQGRDNELPYSYLKKIQAQEMSILFWFTEKDRKQSLKCRPGIRTSKQDEELFVMPFPGHFPRTVPFGGFVHPYWSSPWKPGVTERAKPVWRILALIKITISGCPKLIISRCNLGQIGRLLGQGSRNTYQESSCVWLWENK